MKERGTYPIDRAGCTAAHPRLLPLVVGDGSPENLGSPLAQIVPYPILLGVVIVEVHVVSDVQPRGSRRRGVPVEEPGDATDDLDDRLGADRRKQTVSGRVRSTSSVESYSPPDRLHELVEPGRLEVLLVGVVVGKDNRDGVLCVAEPEVDEAVQLIVPEDVRYRRVVSVHPCAGDEVLETPTEATISLGGMTCRDGRSRGTRTAISV